ncbi:MAG TPA: AbrB/MazE/SpoVT family DNA-binding domain-containing protein [Bacillota bacterium]|jgi:antitoxin MazE|nr:AbrB/MazE/SpoVT family DNA-binding domain-containing protein [Bacillota bacterium]HQE65837.1 AbrB/MazE/SpoVT family DNA-binding domain-containing protein [Bacillota bacterium]HQI17504.1 AbrB/MazE/SpoVT family DNA-binding domain-containing protein [Bacillota bacterium]HQJ36583.1 AbrB/MazE/SpoVT family DNA-binding domain-containing protein [Bacillota bacterium]HQL37034.1 AbrB/MazE/SpoVT family DNA-binding domain-containing protein [Bacillota bacterium]
MYSTKVQKWGNSQGVRIPKYILEKAKLNEGDAVEISVEDDRIIIFQPKRQLKQYTINELFENYKAEYKPEEPDWGEPAGKEEW